MKKRTTVKTYRLITLAIVLLFCAVIAKLAYVVLNDEVDGINLQEKSKSITITSKTLYSSRGSIYDSQGEKLASTVNSYTLIAYLSEKHQPDYVVDKEYTAKQLATVLDIPEDQILKYLNPSNPNTYQVEFGPKGHNLTELQKNNILELNLPGIGFSSGIKRYYDMSSFASYIIGYAKEDENGQIQGELGIEKYFNKELSGKDGKKIYQKYTSGKLQIANTPEIVEPAQNGSDIYLTIDSNIQLIAEKAMSKYNEYNVDWAVFTVMDAKTGAIVASATNPNFNPNDTNSIKSYMNPLVSYQYEPGSVMKIFSFASAIEEGKYNGSATYQSGSIQVADAVIRDANRAGWGTITYDTGFAYSSNVAATRLALELGISTLSDYYSNLGFGKKTGIELSNEVEGDIDITYKTELANASFGQGVSVTPVQMLQALSTMTNDGNVLKPYIVDKIVDSDGNTIFKGERTVVNNVYSPQTVEKMHHLMHMVVYDGLTTMWQVPNVSVMGKTGTAQMASNGKYLNGEYDYIKSFAAIFPEDDPKYIVYVAAQRVHGTARNFATPVTTAIEEIANYAKISDNDTEENTTKVVNIDNYLSKEVNTVIPLLENKKIKIITIGDGKYITNQFPSKESGILLNEKLFLKTNGKQITLPNLIGWSRNDVETYCSFANITCNFTGYGYVNNQSLPAESIITPDTVLEISLSST